MKIQTRLYEKYFGDFKFYIEKRSEAQQKHAVLEYSACTGIPILITYNFMVRLGINPEYYKERIAEVSKDQLAELVD